jgi:hypothetical protein
MRIDAREILRMIAFFEEKERKKRFGSFAIANISAPAQVASRFRGNSSEL